MYRLWTVSWNGIEVVIRYGFFAISNDLETLLSCKGTEP